jgi:hypothetical protein
MDQDPHFVGTNGGRIFRLTVAQMAWATCPSPTVRHKPTGRCPCHGGNLNAAINRHCVFEERNGILEKILAILPVLVLLVQRAPVFHRA